MWSFFIHRFVQFTHKYHALKTHLTQIYKKMWNLSDIHSFINVLTNEVQTYEWMNVTRISHLLINSCVKCVFNAWYQCVKHMIYEWTNFTWFPLLNCEMLSLWFGVFNLLNSFPKKTPTNIMCIYKCNHVKDQLNKKPYWSTNRSSNGEFMSFQSKEYKSTKIC